MKYISCANGLITCPREMYFFNQNACSTRFELREKHSESVYISKDLRFLRIISGTGPQILFDFLIVDIKSSERGNKMC